MSERPLYGRPYTGHDYDGQWDIPRSGNCQHCQALVHHDSGAGALVDDTGDEWCPDGERHELPAPAF